MAATDKHLNIGAADRRRTYRLVMAVGGVGSLFLTLFGVNAFVRDSMLLGGILTATALGVGVSMFAVTRTGRVEIGTQGISLAIVFTFVGLLVTGGVAGTGPLWCYPLTLMVVLLQGFRRGVVVVTGLLIITLLLWYLPGLAWLTADYDAVFKARFVSSYAALAIMAVIYEHLRWTTHRDVVAISHELDHASRTDALTGLVNRRDMLERLEDEVATHTRYGEDFAIIMVDIDHFKQINDRYGHASGDRLLVKFADRLADMTRHSDVVARWGGEEFLILLSHTDPAQANVVAAKLHSNPLRVHLAGQGSDILITASFGVASFSERVDLTELIALADDRLYQAKHQGRDCVVDAESPLDFANRSDMGSLARAERC